MGWTDGRREPDSGLGYTQDWNPQRWTADRDRETEGRQTNEGIPEITGIRRSSQWDFPRRRALFTSDGTYSGSSESDTSEGHVDRPPEGQYDTGRRTEEGHDEDGVEELGFPHKTFREGGEPATTGIERLPHGIRNHEKTISGAGGEPMTVKTGKIYLDPGPKVLGKI